jgi:hypothetical protein
MPSAQELRRLMPYLGAILGLLLFLTMALVGYQLHALNQTLDCLDLRQEQVLREHQEFLDEHVRRMERYERGL